MTHVFCLQITNKNIYPIIFQFLQEGARIQAQLTLSLTTLAKTKEKYEKAFGASEKAMEAYNKADADLNLSRADVEKQRMNSNIKRQQMDDSKNEYANQLQKTNELQVRARGGAAINIKILICPPTASLRLPCCDQRQIGDTTPLVISPRAHYLLTDAARIYHLLYLQIVRLQS